MKIATQLNKVLFCMSDKHQQILLNELPQWIKCGASEILLDWVVEPSGTMSRTVSALEKSEPKRWLAFGISKNYLIFRLQARSVDEVFLSEPLILNKVPKEIVLFLEQRLIPACESSKITIYTPLHQKHPGLCEYALLGMLTIEEQEFIVVSDQRNPLSCINWVVLPIDFERKVCWQIGLNMDRKLFDDFLNSSIGEQVAVNDSIFGTKVCCEKMGAKGVVWHWVFQQDNDKERVPKLIRKFKLGEFLF